ncbi:hypothetical protein CBR_g37864 [Chara braunii]|uniref:Uncharacterized protein n=1 Tax=Chara braunii TaxID=69332 RepID=A0A388LNZ5_CHABU|nr:hypothetical protein CBR_g37864 [Chara braunii]|eukprot:GBG83991.1 hypothetical protein CBR_g37864 [Chara braunii]
MATENDEDLKRIERCFIKRWSPTFNPQDRHSTQSKRRKKRLGKRERKGRRSLKVMRGSILHFEDENGARTTKISDYLQQAIKSGSKDLHIVCSGDIWCEDWKVLTRRFGMSLIKMHGVACLLKEGKKAIEQGGVLTIKDPAETVIFPVKIRREFLLLLTQPWRRKLLWKKEVNELSYMYQASRGYDNRSRQRMRNIVSRVLNEKVGINVRKKHTLKVPYDDRVNRKKIRDVAKEKIDDLGMSDEMTNIVQRHIRVVLTKKQTIGDLFHNHREFARSNGSICNCADSPFPLVEGHVRCCLSDLQALDFFFNARNIPVQHTRQVRRGIMAALLDGLGELFSSAGRPLNIQMIDVEQCVEDKELTCEDWLQEVQLWKRRLAGLVCMPLDRNMGATYITRPVVYARAVRDTFWHGESFNMCEMSDDMALARCKEEYEERGLRRLGSWRGKGRFGDAYVIPKQKDPSRWRPIAPAWNAPMKEGAKKVARAMQCMLGCLARKIHFNTHLFRTRK